MLCLGWPCNLAGMTIRLGRRPWWMLGRTVVPAWGDAWRPAPDFSLLLDTLKPHEKAVTRHAGLIRIHLPFKQIMHPPAVLLDTLKNTAVDARWYPPTGRGMESRRGVKGPENVEVDEAGGLS